MCRHFAASFLDYLRRRGLWPRWSISFRRHTRRFDADAHMLDGA